MRNAPGSTAPSYLHAVLPALEFPPEVCGEIPDEAACRTLWKGYDMLPNVARHSLRVARFARAMAERAAELGKGDVRLLTLAAGLLHDLAKSYTVRYGGSHAQLGASWVMTHTGNPCIAQAVLHHVWWPWALPERLASPVFFVLYADKRVMHDRIVGLETRRRDLLRRYGTNAAAREAISAGNALAENLERAMSAYLEIDLHACTLVGGRLVERA
jgi:putative nucleotidyltransferase with HDIG domain